MPRRAKQKQKGYKLCLSCEAARLWNSASGNKIASLGFLQAVKCGRALPLGNLITCIKHKGNPQTNNNTRRT